MTESKFSFVDKKEHTSWRIGTYRMHYEYMDAETAHIYFTTLSGDYVGVPMSRVVLYHCPRNSPNLNVKQEVIPAMLETPGKSRSGYLYSYYSVSLDKKYEVHFRSDCGSEYKKVLSIVPTSYLEFVNHGATEYRIETVV